MTCSYKFKVGDRIRCIKHPGYGHLVVGDIYKVLEQCDLEDDAYVLDHDSYLFYRGVYFAPVKIEKTGFGKFINRIEA